MKTAIYIEDGMIQVVLLPESPTDKAVMDQLEQTARHGKLTTFRGDFWRTHYGYAVHENTFQGRALIFLIEKSEEEASA